MARLSAKNKRRLEVSARCRAFRHHNFDGHTFLEHRDRGEVWVARLECGYCGTTRVDVMEPFTCQLLSRDYPEFGEGYDPKLDTLEAKQYVFRRMFVR